MKPLSLTLALLFAISIPITSTAFADEGQEGHREKSEEQRAAHRDNRRAAMDMIHAHMVSSGAMSEADVEARKAAHEAQRQEFEALSAAGDQEALKEKRETLKQSHRGERERIKQYVQDNPELQEQLKAHRDANGGKPKKHKKDQEAE